MPGRAYLDFLVGLPKFVNASRGWHRHPRNGKVARLPEPLRNRINLMLEEGLPYRDIIANLQQAGDLPYPISEMNLSNWCRGGFRDWTRNKARTAAAIPAEFDAPEAVSRHLATLQACANRRPQPPAHAAIAPAPGVASGAAANCD